MFDSTPCPPPPPCRRKTSTRRIGATARPSLSTCTHRVSAHSPCSSCMHSEEGPPRSNGRVSRSVVPVAAGLAALG